jgi:hypothetical protein
MVNLPGLVSVAGAAPHDQFTKSERDAEGFSVHADADEHSRHAVLEAGRGRDNRSSQLRLSRARAGRPRGARAETDWPGYFGTPAIARVEAGRRKMDGLAAAAVDAALKALDGLLPATAAGR